MSKKIEISQEEAVAIWKALQSITESMVRLGRLWITQGEDVAKDEIVKFFGPATYEKLDAAELTLVRAVAEQDSEPLESIADLTGDEERWSTGAHNPIKFDERLPSSPTDGENFLVISATT